MNNRLIMATVLAIAATGVSAQEISARHQIVDCGGVKFEQPVTVNFEMKNKGQQLRISEVRPDCGCTTVSFPRQPIGDGESFVISATMLVNSDISASSWLFIAMPRRNHTI